MRFSKTVIENFAYHKLNYECISLRNINSRKLFGKCGFYVNIRQLQNVYIALILRSAEYTFPSSVTTEYIYSTVYTCKLSCNLCSHLKKIPFTDQHVVNVPMSLLSYSLHVIFFPFYVIFLPFPSSRYFSY